MGLPVNYPEEPAVDGRVMLFGPTSPPIVFHFVGRVSIGIAGFFGVVVLRREEHKERDMSAKAS